jgi:serine protease Do
LACPRRAQSALIVTALALSWLAVAAPSPTAHAQSAIQATMERLGPVSEEKRAELFGQLKSQAEVLQAQAAVVKTVAKLIGPTVVHIEADVTGRTALQHTPQYGRARQVEEAGSGVVVRFKDDCYVLTNRHLIACAKPEKINIHLADGRQIHPTHVWDDVETDVAVMAVSAPHLAAAPIGDSDALEIGDFVLAVGSPFGLSYSVTYGIVSAKGRRGLDLGRSGVRLQDFIQTDAAINPGNSGGPLINLQAEVIGINTAIASNSGGSEGIGFAIPINMFMLVARQLIQKGKMSCAFLGVNLDSNFGPDQALQAGLPRPMGARVATIWPESPASEAKIEPHDVILQIGDVLIEDDAHLVDVMHLTEVGKRVPLVIWRDGQELQVYVTVGDWDDFH